MFHKSEVEIWSRGYICSFRRKVVRVGAQMAFRVNSQSGKHCPWKPNCHWRDATNRWTSSRHYVPVTHLSAFTERCCCCTCCRQHRRWIPEYLDTLDVIQYFPSKSQLFSGCPSRRLSRQHCGPGQDLGKEHETGVKGAGHNFRKNDISSVQFSHSVVSDYLQPHEPKHTRAPCPSPTPGLHPNPCPSSRWCHPTIYPLSSPSPPALNPSQHQGLFQWVNSSHQVTKVLGFQLQHQSFQWTPRTDLL